MFGETYSLGLITKFLKEKGIAYEPRNANVGFTMHDHGCAVKINDTYTLSIQTHPMIAGESFAETGLQNTITKKIVYDGTYRYWDVRRFKKPQDLFDHIEWILNPATSAAPEPYERERGYSEGGSLDSPDDSDDAQE